MDKEIRSCKLEWRTDAADPRHVEGVAAVFGSESEDLGFFETIEPEAITDDVINASDVFCMLNHDDSRGILARSKYGNGSLKLWREADGLHYSFSAPRTALGDELLEYLQRGDITASSFAFTVEADEWANRDGNVYRTIKKINRLYDVSPVFQPAYSATSVAQRKADAMRTDAAAIIGSLDKVTAELDDIFGE